MNVRPAIPLTAFWFLALLLAPRTGWPQAAFSTSTEMVRLDVRVTSDGKAVRDLTVDDFEVWDNGVRQAVRFIGSDAQRLSLVVALDVSGSVQGERLARLKKAGEELLRSVRAVDRVVVLTFAESIGARMVSGRVDDAALEANDLPNGTLTTLRDAAFASLLHADEPDARPLVVIFSDGMDTMSWLSPEQVLDTARRRSAVVYAVVTGLAPHFLDRLAEATGGRVMVTDPDQSLASAFRRVIDDFRMRYFLGYVPTNVSQEGWHEVQVRTKDPRLMVEARRGYRRGSPDRERIGR